MGKEPREYFNDRVGRAVHVGDRIAYAVRAGSSLWLNEAVVEKIEVSTWATRSGFERQDWRITVQAKGGSRKSYLETPNRIVLVETAQETERDRHPVNLITFGEGAYE